MRVVFDTNVLIDGFADDFSASARLIDAVRDGGLEAVVTAPLVREYNRILARLIDDPKYTERIHEFMSASREATPGRADIQLDDAEDVKVANAAVGNNVDLIVSSDHHLLDAGEIDGIRVVTPREAWAIYQEEAGESEWDSWRKGLGL